MVLQPPPDVVTSVLDEMVEYMNPDGTIQVSKTSTRKLWSTPDCANGRW